MTKATLATLLHRAAAGREPDKKRMFRPSTVYRVMNHPFELWCDYHAPQSEAVEEVSRYNELQMRRGGEFELEWVKANYPDAVFVKRYYGIDALKETFQAMLAGARVIHAPQLWALPDELYGKGDLIVRCDDAPSDLGRYHYRVKEVKRSKEPQTYHILQALVYNRMLDRIQGYRPPHLDIVLKNDVATVESDKYEKKLDKLLEEWRQIRDGKVKPDLPGYDEADSPWRPYTNKLLEKRKDLTTLPWISASARDKIAERLGLKRADEINKLKLNDCVKALGAKTGPVFYYKYKAYQTGRPTLVPGASVEIPRAKRHLYFDFETSDNLHRTLPPHIYMIGVYDLEQKQYKVFVAHGPEEEQKIFEDFLDYIGNPCDVRLYHWTSYEIGEIKRFVERCPALKSRMEKLVKSCVDLKKAIEKKVYFASRDYSIKNVAPSVGFHWKDEDVTDGREAMVWYWDWLEGGDQNMMDKIIQYNTDDCLAMVHIDKVLEKCLS